MKVETTDIYFSAYLMVKGVSLASMSVGNGAGRPKVLFTFSGHGELSRLNREFQQGKALVNLIDLKKTMLHLKDMMYDQIRTNRDERRLKHANHKGRDRDR